MITDLQDELDQYASTVDRLYSPIWSCLSAEKEEPAETPVRTDDHPQGDAQGEGARLLTRRLRAECMPAGGGARCAPPPASVKGRASLPVSQAAGPAGSRGTPPAAVPHAAAGSVPGGFRATLSKLTPAGPMAANLPHKRVARAAAVSILTFAAALTALWCAPRVSDAVAAWLRTPPVHSATLAVAGGLPLQAAAPLARATTRSSGEPSSSGDAVAAARAAAVTLDAGLRFTMLGVTCAVPDNADGVLVDLRTSLDGRRWSRWYTTSLDVQADGRSAHAASLHRGHVDRRGQVRAGRRATGGRLRRAGRAPRRPRGGHRQHGARRRRRHRAGRAPPHGGDDRRPRPDAPGGGHDRQAGHRDAPGVGRR